MTQSSLPVGNIIKPIAHVDLPQRRDYGGRFITLSPVSPQTDVAELYTCSHGSIIKEQIWTYMSYGPFDSKHNMQEWLEEGAKSEDPLFFTAHHLESKQRVGMVSFLNIVSDMRRLELGHIWYSPDSQRSNANTEAIYLMLCETFDRLKYRRVEWKCDALNEKSRAAKVKFKWLTSANITLRSVPLTANERSQFLSYSIRTLSDRAIFRFPYCKAKY